MAEIRDDTVKEVLEKLRHLSYDIEKTNKRFDAVDRTGDTLEDVRVRLDHHENDMTNGKNKSSEARHPCPHKASRRELIDSRSLCTLGNATACLGFQSISTHGLYPPSRKTR